MVDIDTVKEAEHTFTEHEHNELLPGLDRVHVLGRRVTHITRHDLARDLMWVTDWITRFLEPHAKWEDTSLYSRIDDAAGTAWATRAMRFEHGQIRALAAGLRHDSELLALDRPIDTDEVRSELFALEAVLRAHIEREEKILFPLLES